jgi:hypothetical protein
MKNGDRFTLRDWLEIYNDLDAYIARGGELLDLPVNTPAGFPPKIEKFIVERLGKEKLDRIGRFFSLVAKRKPNNRALIGEFLSEEQLRSIWRGTDLARN